MMQYSVLYEAINDPGFAPGYYYAHIPALDLTTHGRGIDGAKAAAQDLVQVWIETKRGHGETVPVESESFFSRIEVDDALFSA